MDRKTAVSFETEKYHSNCNTILYVSQCLKNGQFSNTVYTISMHDYIFSKIVDEGKNFYSPTMDLKDTHMCLAFHSFVAK